jgi:hypothetical protein
MVSQYRDYFEITSEQAQKFYMSVQNPESLEDEAKVERSFNSTINYLKAQLPDGEELDWEIVWTLIASDQFSGLAKEVYDAYKDTQMTWQILLDNKDLEKQIQNA